MNNRRKLIIGILTLLVVSVMGYALFSETVSINGSATGNGNLSVIFESAGPIKEVGSNGATAKIEKGGKLLNITANNLQYPGSYVEIPITIKNNGTINAYISNLNIDGYVLVPEGDGYDENGNISGNKIQFKLFSSEERKQFITYNNIQKNMLLKSNSSIQTTIKMNWPEFDEIYDGENSIKGLHFLIDIVAVQSVNDLNSDTEINPRKFSPGSKFCIADNECFYVIKAKDDMITALAEKNIDTVTMKQSLTAHNYAFSKTSFWVDSSNKILPLYGTPEVNGITSDNWDEYKIPPKVYPPKSQEDKESCLIDDVLERYKNSLNVDIHDIRLLYYDEFSTLHKDVILNTNFWFGNAANHWRVWGYAEGYGLVHAGKDYNNDSNGFGVRPVITINKADIK